MMTYEEYIKTVERAWLDYETSPVYDKNSTVWTYLDIMRPYYFEYKKNNTTLQNK
jgi:hypothetical protein